MSGLDKDGKHRWWISVVVVPILVAAVSSPVWAEPICQAFGLYTSNSSPAPSPSASGDQNFVGTIRDVGDVRAVVFSPDGRFLATAGGNDHTVLLWNASNGDQVRILTGCCVVDAITFSPNGKFLATGSELFDPATGQRIRKLGGGAYGVAFSPDGDLVATANGYEPNGVRLFQSSTGEMVRLETPEYANAVAFSPDGTLVAAATGYKDAGIVLWNVASGERVRTLEAGSAALAFSPDGRLLASSGRGKVELWNPTTGEHIRDIGASVVLSFSPDGARLAVAGEDKTVQLYDPATGNPIRTLTGVYADKLAFSPDGMRIATVSPNRVVQVNAVSTA